MVRAFASHARGPEFEPLHLYQNKVRIVTVAMSRRIDSDFLFAKIFTAGKNTGNIAFTDLRRTGGFGNCTREKSKGRGFGKKSGYSLKKDDTEKARSVKMA